MNYLAAFLRANGKQVATAVLSIGWSYFFWRHPEWKEGLLMFLVLLGSYGIHLQPLVYSPEKINARLGLDDKS